MNTTKIEWATHSASYQAGCTKVKKGGGPSACDSCYSIPLSARIERMGGPARYAGVAVVEKGKEPRWTGKVTSDLDAMRRIFDGLAAAKRPRRVFLNSMTDTFHEAVTVDTLDELAANIRLLDSRMRARTGGQHVVMLLTKRPPRMRAFQACYFPAGFPSWLWCGVTVDDQRRADERIRTLLRTEVQRGGVRFLSCEPLLGAVDLEHVPYDVAGKPGTINALTGWPVDRRIHWVISGAESGPHARPSHPEWFRSLRDQCARAGTAFFHKQNGEWLAIDQMDFHERESDLYEPAPEEDPERARRCRVPELVLRTDGNHRRLGDLEAFRSDLPGWPAVHAFRVGKKSAGRLLDGVEHSAVPPERP